MENKDMKEDKVVNTVTIKMDSAKFVKAIGLGDYKGKVKKVYACLGRFDDDGKVEIDVTFEMEDRLKQIDYTKTVE